MVYTMNVITTYHFDFPFPLHLKKFDQLWLESFEPEKKKKKQSKGRGGEIKFRDKLIKKE